MQLSRSLYIICAVISFSRYFYFLNISHLKYLGSALLVEQKFSELPTSEVKIDICSTSKLVRRHSIFQSIHAFFPFALHVGTRVNFPFDARPRARRACAACDKTKMRASLEWRRSFFHLSAVQQHTHWHWHTQQHFAPRCGRLSRRTIVMRAPGNDLAFASRKREGKRESEWERRGRICITLGHQMCQTHAHNLCLSALRCVCACDEDGWRLCKNSLREFFTNYIYFSILPLTFISQSPRDERDLTKNSLPNFHLIFTTECLSKKHTEEKQNYIHIHAYSFIIH